jgi:integrase/recombinase XerD
VAIPRETYERLERFAKHARGAYIFESKRTDGRQLDRHGVDKLVRNLSARANIAKRVYPHLLRHSYASHMIVKGINLVVLQKTLGHESLAMLSTTYGHVLAEDSHDDLMRALR